MGMIRNVSCPLLECLCSLPNQTLIPALNPTLTEHSPRTIYPQFPPPQRAPSTSRPLRKSSLPNFLDLPSWDPPSMHSIRVEILMVGDRVYIVGLAKVQGAGLQAEWKAREGGRLKSVL